MSRSNYLQIRLSDIEQANYKSFANREGVTVAEWARTKLNEVAISEIARNEELDKKVEIYRIWSERS